MSMITNMHMSTVERSKMSDGWHAVHHGFMHMKDGKLHREDGPAKIWLYPTYDRSKLPTYVIGQEWYVNGERHRTDGPAGFILFINMPGSHNQSIHGTLNWRKHWNLNGVDHREDGPSHITSKGYISYSVNGQLHRTDGPAVIDENGQVSWCLNGETVTLDEFLNQATISGEEKVQLKLEYG